MSFGGKQNVPTKAPVPANVQASDVSSNQEAVSVRWFVGEDWCPVDWIIPEPLNVVTKEIRQKAGKGATSTQYEYYADVAGITSVGMIDAVTAVEIDGNIVWSGTASRPADSGHPDFWRATLHSDAFDAIYIYWGRPDQPLDDILLAPLGASSPELAHPAYRHQVLVVVKKLRCGSASTVPNIRVRQRRAAKPQIGNFPAFGSPQGESIVGGILELATDPIFGAGFEAGRFVASEWENLSQSVVDAVGCLSPFLDRARPFRDVFRDFALYFDGFCRIENGVLKPGFHPHNGNVPSGLPVIDMHAFTDDPTWEVATPADTVNDVVVVYRDRDEKWKQRPAYGSDSANIRARRAIQTAPVEMLGFLDGVQAAKWATEAAATGSEGLAEGSGQLRPSRARRSDGSLILPGENFVFDHARLLVSQVVRLRRRSDPFRGPVSFEFESERGVFPSPYVPPIDIRPRPGRLFPNSVVRARIWEVPKQVAGNVRSKNPIAVLAQRPSSVAQAPFNNLKAKNVVGANVWISADNAIFDPLGSLESWGSYGTLREALNSAPGDCVVKVAFDAAAIDLDRIVPQREEAKSNDTLLIIIGDEVFSAGSITLSGLNYDITCARSRQGTSPSSHAQGVAVWAVWRDELAVIDSLGPKQLTTRWFKLQPYTKEVVMDLADVPAIGHAFGARTPAQPTGLSAVAGSGLIVSLRWDNPEGSNISEFEVWRHTSNDLANASWAADVRATRFVDIFGLTSGATYYYWVRGVDEDEEFSPFSSVASATPTAAVGPQGPQGTQGLPGQAGQNGLTSYFHVAYADSANGTVNFNQTAGKYIGTYVDYTPADSTNPASYVWRKFEGTDGIPGINGANGQTSYLHIKYSDDGGATFTANNGEAPGAWLGTTVDFNAPDPGTPAAYTWVKVQGPQGPQGNQGIPGAPGQNGLTSYFHVAYADSANGTLNFNQTAGKYVGTYVDYSPADSLNPASYVWRKFEGTDGIPGINGANGQTSYLHLKYSNDGGVTFTGNGGEDVGAWIGTVVDFNPTDPVAPSAYSWGKVQGYRDVDPPAAPGNPTLEGGGTYIDVQDRVWAYVSIRMPAMPVGAIGMNLLLRKRGGSGWAIVDQDQTGSELSQIDDLVPDQEYEAAVVAFNNGKTSATVPLAAPGWFRAPKKTGQPANATNFQAHIPSSNHPVPLRMFSKIQMLGASLTWDASIDGDVSGIQLAFHSSGVVPPGEEQWVKADRSPYFYYDPGVLVPAYVWTRVVNSSKVYSTPLFTGINMNGHLRHPAGSMVTQDTSDTRVTGITTGNGGATRKILVEHHDNVLHSLGYNATSFQINLGGLGFGNRPDAGSGGHSSWESGAQYIEVSYNWDNSSSSVATFNVRSADGNPISGGLYRFTIHLFEYD